MAQTKRQQYESLRYHTAKAQMNDYLTYRTKNPLSSISFKRWLELDFYCGDKLCATTLKNG
jgi:hypothetical protein